MLHLIILLPNIGPIILNIQLIRITNLMLILGMVHCEVVLSVEEGLGVAAGAVLVLITLLLIIKRLPFISLLALLRLTTGNFREYLVIKFHLITRCRLLDISIIIPQIIFTTLLLLLLLVRRSRELILWLFTTVGEEGEFLFY